MNAFRSLNNVVERVCLVLSSIGMALMAAVLVLQVFMRYVVGHATSWSDEMATVLFVWSVMLAIAIGIRRHEHVAVEFFINKLPPMPHRIARIIIEGLVAYTLCTVGIASIGLLPSAGRQLLTGTSLALGIDVPLSVMYLAAPVGCFITTWFCLERILYTALGKPQWEDLHSSEGSADTPATTQVTEA